MNNRIKKFLPRTKQIELKTRADVSDYFYLTLVLGAGLFISILIFVGTASYLYREAQQQFENSVTVVQSSITGNVARQTLEFEFLAKSILDARHEISLKKSALVRRRINESDFACVILVGTNKSIYDKILKGGSDCSVRNQHIRTLLDKIKSDGASPGQDFQSQVSRDLRGDLHIGLVAPLNYPSEQYLLALFPADSLFPKGLGRIEGDLFQTGGGIGGAFKKSSLIGPAVPLTRMIPIGDQEFPVYFGPVSGGYDVKLGWAWTVLAFGLAITGLLGVMIYNLIGKNMEVQEEVERKTKDLQIATSEAVRANETKTRFLANVSHEVRTPLNLILGIADLLTETPLNQEQSRYVATFKKSGKHLLEIINDILDVANIEVNSVAAESEALDLIELLEGVSDSISVACRNKKITFDHAIAPNVPRVIESNPKRLRQILINLLNNAIKFTDRGQIMLGVSIDPAGDLLTFKVKDTGIGIPPAHMERVYDSFYQINSSSTRAKGGVGLGLHIVKTCVDQMGGEIKLESEVGVGTAFFVRIPLKTPNLQGWIDELKTKQKSKPGGTVFLLTPNPVQSAFLQTSLEHLGYQVSAHSFGHGALKERPRGSFDFYLVDLIGQDLGGLEFLSLAGLPTDELKKVVILCPLVHRAGDFQAMKHLGVQRLCNTPVKMKALLQCFNEIRSGRESHFEKTVELKSVPPLPVNLKKNLRLLVAEDDEDNRFLIQAYLETYGIEICFAENGIAALEQFKTVGSRFDLVVTDIQMPRMDGFELIKEIREWEKTKRLRKLPIIALTADAQPEQVENVKKLGGNEYLKKPISKSDLLEMISRYQDFAKAPVA